MSHSQQGLGGTFGGPQLFSFWYRKIIDNSWVEKHLQPDPLHVNVLSPSKKLFDLMEKVFSKEKVTDFYRPHNEKRSGDAARGKFDGKAIKNLRSEEALEDLKQNFPAEKEPFFQLLRNLREVHEIL